MPVADINGIHVDDYIGFTRKKDFAKGALSTYRMGNCTVVQLAVKNKWTFHCFLAYDLGFSAETQKAKTLRGLTGKLCNTITGRTLTLQDHIFDNYLQSIKTKLTDVLYHHVAWEMLVKIHCQLSIFLFE